MADIIPSRGSPNNTQLGIKLECKYQRISATLIFSLTESRSKKRAMIPVAKEWKKKSQVPNCHTHVNVDRRAGEYSGKLRQAHVTIERHARPGAVDVDVDVDVVVTDDVLPDLLVPTLRGG